MRLHEIMSSPVHSVRESDSIETAREIMRRERIRHLAVLDGVWIRGLISERDIIAAPREARVRDVLIGQVVAASPHTTVREAANLLRGHSIGSLLVVDGERLVGIVTVTDLLDLIGRGVERPVARTKRWTLKHRGPRRHVR